MALCPTSRVGAKIVTSRRTLALASSICTSPMLMPSTSSAISMRKLVRCASPKDATSPAATASNRIDGRYAPPGPAGGGDGGGGEGGIRLAGDGGGDGGREGGAAGGGPCDGSIGGDRGGIDSIEGEGPCGGGGGEAGGGSTGDGGTMGEGEVGSGGSAGELGSASGTSSAIETYPNSGRRSVTCAPAVALAQRTRYGAGSWEAS